MSKLLDIPLHLLREPANKLRPVVKDSEGYMGMVESIKRQGVLNPILVREIVNPVNPDVTNYEVIEGNHRFNASVDAGKSTIPAQVMNLDETQLYDAQIIGNIHRIETKPVEYSKQLKAILDREKTLTSTELAARLGKSNTWLNERLGLVKLKPELATLVDGNQISLSNAFDLAKLSEEDQELFKDRAMTEDVSVFRPAVSNHLKQARDAIRQGKDPNAVAVFEPHAKLQTIQAVKDALADKAIVGQIIQSANADTPSAAAEAALKWVLHLDPVSLSTAKAKWEADNAERNAKKEKAKLEREEKAKLAAAAAPAPAVA